MLKGVPFWSGIISGGISQFEDTVALSKGKLGAKQYAVHTTSNISGGIGIMAGVEYGAIIGTAILPGIGTLVGSVLLGIMGSRIGYSAGYQTGKFVFDNPVRKDYMIEHNSMALPARTDTAH